MCQRHAARHAARHALERAASERGAPKSALVREAVATYLTARPLRPEVRPMLADPWA